MAIQQGTQALLVEVVANGTDAAAEDDKTVERANLGVLVSFFRGEGAAVAEEVDEADSDAAVDVQGELRGKKERASHETKVRDIQYRSWRW